MTITIDRTTHWSTLWNILFTKILKKVSSCWPVLCCLNRKYGFRNKRCIWKTSIWSWSGTIHKGKSKDNNLSQIVILPKTRISIMINISNNVIPNFIFDLSCPYIEKTSHQSQFVEVWSLLKYLPYIRTSHCALWCQFTINLLNCCDTSTIWIKYIRIMVSLHNKWYFIRVCCIPNKMRSFSSIFLNHKRYSFSRYPCPIDSRTCLKIIELFNNFTNISFTISDSFHQSIRTSLTFGLYHLL